MSGQNALFPHLAIAPDGATTVTWYRSNGTNDIVQAATRPAGSNTFGAPQNLSLTGQNAVLPQVAVALDGATTVTWSRGSGNSATIQAATRPAGSSSFGAPVDLSQAGQGAFSPELAVAPDGATTVTWQRFDGSNEIIQAATRPAGSSSFSAPEDLSQAGRDAERSQVAVAPDGATTVTWQRSNGSNDIVQAATRPAGSSSFSAPEDLSQAGQNAYDSQLAVATDGATTVTWTRSNGSNEIIQAATRPAGSSSFGAPEDLSQAGRGAYEARVAVAPDGATTVTWQRFDDSFNFIIQATTRPAGSSTFSPPENLSQAGQSAFNPQLAVAPDGAVTVTWHLSNGSYTIVQAVSNGDLPPSPGNPELRLAVDTPKKVKAGKAFGITVKTSNVAENTPVRAARNGNPTTATQVKTCAKLPKGLFVVKRNGGKVKGRTICWTRSSLAAGRSLTYRVTVRSSKGRSGSVRVSGTATASNSAGTTVRASSSGRIRIVMPGVPDPQPPTG